MAWKDLNDHCGEFGSDKDFFINWNIGIDGCCQVSPNPYYTSSSNGRGIIIQIGQNTRKNYIKWGTDFIFDNHLETNIPNDARLYTVPEISGQCGDGSRRVRFNHKIKAIMKIFYNYKYQSIPSLELYYRDEDYPSRPDRYPWNFMFIFAREDSKCYYQTYDSEKEKINYLGRVDLTGFVNVDAFFTWRGGSYNERLVTYGNKMRMNWYTKDMYSSSTGVGLRYYLKRAMKDNQYSGDKTISGRGAIINNIPYETRLKNFNNVLQDILSWSPTIDGSTQNYFIQSGIDNYDEANKAFYDKVKRGDIVTSIEMMSLPVSGYCFIDDFADSCGYFGSDGSQPQFKYFNIIESIKWHTDYDSSVPIYIKLKPEYEC